MKDDLKDIKKKWPKKMPNGIIHSDLFIDNIFFNQGKFHGFIDFYFSANDFLSYELATCINALCFRKKNRKFILFRKRKFLRLFFHYIEVIILSFLFFYLGYFIIQFFLK